MDYDGFQSLNDQLCRNNRCDGDNELDAAHPSSTGDQNAMIAFTSNAQDTIVHSLNRDTCSVKDELASVIYHVDGDDNDTAAEG